MLETKYAQLIAEAKAFGANDLQVRQDNNVLYIDGTVNTGAHKDALWNTYNAIDPDYRSADLVLNINVDQAVAGTQFKVTTESSNLNVRKGPGTDQPVVGKAAHGSTVTLLSDGDQWALIRTQDGVEGYCYKQYLTQM